MKIALLSIFFLMALAGCSHNNEKAKMPDSAAVPAAKEDTAENFFPVTTYLRGEIAQIKTIGITPVKKHIKNDITLDSSWVKPENFLTEFADFLTPEIDTANLKPYYVQNKFLDQSVNAFTFTYDPVKTLPDSMPLLHWDIYVDPKTESVRRVFIRKKKGADEEQQLTWQSGKWCKIVTIKNTGTNPAIISEIKIEWSFE